MKQKQILFVILGLVILVRVTLALIMWGNFGLEGFYELDSKGCYVDTAKALVSQKAFTSSGIPDIVRTPGYPVFLIPGVLLGQVEIFAIVMNILLSCLSCYLILKITLLIFENVKIALLASIFYAFEPLSVMYSVKIMSETLCVCLILLFTYLLILYFQRRTLIILLFCSLVLAAAVYTRPVNYFLSLYLTLVIGFFSVLRDGTKAIKNIMPMLLLVLLSFVLVFPWQVRNKIKTGYIGFSAYGDVTLYIHQLASMVSMEENIPFLKAQEKLFIRLSEDLKLNPLDQNSWAKKDIYEYMFKQTQEKTFNNPLLYFRLYLKQMMPFFWGPRPKELMNVFIPLSYCPETKQDKINDFYNFFDEFRVCPKAAWIYWPSGAGILVSFLYYIFAAYAFLTKRIKINLFTIILLAIAFYAIIFPKGGLLVPSRYRLPIMPAICIFGACAFFSKNKHIKLD